MKIFPSGRCLLYPKTSSEILSSFIIFAFPYTNPIGPSFLNKSNCRVNLSSYQISSQSRKAKYLPSHFCVAKNLASPRGIVLFPRKYLILLSYELAI